MAGHKVMSFEPTPSKARKIKQALAEAGVEDSVDFYSYAISDKSGVAPFVVNVAVHMEQGKWVVNTGESKDVKNIGSEQDGFRVPWNTENSTTVDVRVEMLDNMVPEGQYVLFAKIDSQVCS
jgi:FkbM family methyltransferase